MGRLIFNSSMGIVGVRGKIAAQCYFKNAQGGIEQYAGGYARRDVRGTSNVMCKLPDFSNRKLSAQQQIAQEKFKSTITAMKALTPAEWTDYENQWKQLADHGKPNAKYPTLRGYVFAFLYKAQ